MSQRAEVAMRKATWVFHANLRATMARTRKTSERMVVQTATKSEYLSRAETLPVSWSSSSLILL